MLSPSSVASMLAALLTQVGAGWLALGGMALAGTDLWRHFRRARSS